MPRPNMDEIHSCNDLRKACDRIGEVPPQERPEVKHQLMAKAIELDCPDSIPDDWHVRIGKDYE